MKRAKYGWQVIAVSVALRKQGWTHAEISGLLGPSPSTISGWWRCYLTFPSYRARVDAVR